MKIELSDQAVITDLPVAKHFLLEDFFTILNPLFHKRLSAGYSNWGIPSSLKYYEKLKNGAIRFPIGGLPDLLKVFKSNGVNITKKDIVDNRISNPLSKSSYIECKAKLLVFQGLIKKSCMNATIGTISAPTGSGKTVTFIDLIVERREPALILVNTVELANQTVEKFVEFTNLTKNDIGFIGDGQFNFKSPVTVGLFQSMHTLTKEKLDIINKTVGLVVADEVHICAAKTYYEVMTKLKSRYTYGFSATPERPDGLTKLIFWASGPLIHTVPPDATKDIRITPSVEVIKTNYFYPLINTDEYVFLLNDLATNEARNKLILEEVEKDGDETWKVLLCGRVSQIELLGNALSDSAIFLHSKLKKKERKQRMDMLISGEKRTVVSSYGIFSTGLDVPQLEILYLCSPMKSQIKIKQSAGRISRICEGKTHAIIKDFVDWKIDLLKFQYYARNRIYKKL